MNEHGQRERSTQSREVKAEFCEKSEMDASLNSIGAVSRIHEIAAIAAVVAHLLWQMEMILGSKSCMVPTLQHDK